MDSRNRTDELRERIRDSVRAYGRPLPREKALAWHGYLAAVLEWGIVSPSQHQELTGMLPAPPGSFITGIFPGHEEAESGDAAHARLVGGDW
jgi:hypothetical protein